MENIFKELKEKIANYKEFLGVNTIEVDSSEVSKIENEIKILKSKIDELTVSMEGKTKIEKMKITLNVSSLESEITLKEMDLEEKKEKAKNDYDKKVKSHNSGLDSVKKDIEDFIINSENKIENNVKSSSNSILLGSDLEEVKNYCKSILDIELKNLKDIVSEEKNLNQKIDTINDEIKELRERRMNLVNEADYWGRKNPTNFWGDWDDDKAEEYREKAEDCGEEVNRCSDIIISKAKNKNLFQNEADKLKIKRETIENKLKVIDEMVNEMIKEVIKEELKKREIMIPSFVPVTKYFNAPDEIEE
ncbi:hypothetical protein OCK72_11155 [Fusobacterium simiae]|uniref:Uncharacterized protein n=1 Tax=Fusobacterium simiae TaxID=855 RepID=A0ABT4DL50_FUSSI|nr:hypothetical protein [Fusobacterium simiae]MCY7009179.1 hypothetical protein [Fusobacterium simiae]